MVDLRPACLALALSLVVFAACGGGPSGPTPTPAAPQNGALTVTAKEWNFQPSRIVLREGEQVRIDFQNGGGILHDFNIDHMQADVSQSESTGPISAGKGDIFVAADAGKSGTLVFTPKEKGSFTFYCTVPRHRQLGMWGTIVVE
jgi:uncharacterized cupredoxin-like copper-binding protein